MFLLGNNKIYGLCFVLPNKTTNIILILNSVISIRASIIAPIFLVTKINTPKLNNRGSDFYNVVFLTPFRTTKDRKLTLNKESNGALFKALDVAKKGVE